MAAESDADRIFDLYRIAVEQADRVSARRASANSYFLTIQTGLAALVGLIGSLDENSDAVPRNDVGLVATAIVGLALCAAWWLLLRSYRDLNAAKFKVITEIEVEHLPLQIFQREWDFLKRDEVLPWWKGRYAELGFVERFIPALFAAVYLALGMRAFLG